MRKVLVTTEILGKENVKRLSRFAEVVESWRLDERTIQDTLPTTDAAIVLSWPRFFTGENLTKMRRLKFIQTLMVGVNHVRFSELPKRVIVCNNAGAFSVEVGEHAWGLLLASAKKIVPQYITLRGGGMTLASFRGDEKDIKVLRGKTLGVVGFGGIGQVAARYGLAFGMRIVAFSRSKKAAPRVRFCYGTRGLDEVLTSSDAVLLAAPLTKSTDRLIGARELGLMKKDAIVVNIARGDLVDQDALYAHLASNPSFRYATDVWWFREGAETLETSKPLASLPNFIGTPHSSGPTGLAGGEPQRRAVENTIRFLRGRAPRNLVNRSDYLGS